MKGKTMSGTVQEMFSGRQYHERSVRRVTKADVVFQSFMRLSMRPLFQGEIDLTQYDLVKHVGEVIRYDDIEDFDHLIYEIRTTRKKDGVPVVALVWVDKDIGHPEEWKVTMRTDDFKPREGDSKKKFSVGPPLHLFKEKDLIPISGNR